MTFQKLTDEEIEALSKQDGIGYFGEYGAIIPEKDCKGVITEGKAGMFLVPREEFTYPYNSGSGLAFCMVEISKRAILAIGGIPETEEEIAAKKNGWSIECARHVLYLRTRSRWTEKLEEELINLHKEGKSVNIMDFGVTAETQAKLYWEASKMARTVEHS